MHRMEGKAPRSLLLSSGCWAVWILCFEALDRCRELSEVDPPTPFGIQDHRGHGRRRPTGGHSMDTGGRTSSGSMTQSCTGSLFVSAASGVCDPCLEYPLGSSSSSSSSGIGTDHCWDTGRDNGEHVPRCNLCLAGRGCCSTWCRPCLPTCLPSSPFSAAHPLRLFVALLPLSVHRQ